MDNPNAFIGKKTAPTTEDISAALGPALAPWNQIISWLQEKHGVSIQEWNSFSPKYGWSLRLKFKKRTIVHLSPCSGCFRVAFILGDRAVTALRQGSPSKAMLTLLNDAPHYPEGTGFRLLIKAGSKDLALIHKLAEIKLEN
jgi:hypothetical protein